MTTAHALQTPVRAQPFRQVLAAEVRAHLARQQLSGRALARLIGESPTWAARRLSGSTAMDADDLERIADVLGISLSELLADAARRADDGVVTGSQTRQYEGASSCHPPVLRLVPGLSTSNVDVAESYGSSAPGGSYGDDPIDEESAGTVNDAHAA